MDDASKACIVPFKLMQIFDLQAVEIAACLCERNLAGIQGIQHRSHKGVTEDMLGFPMAVLPTATLSWYNSQLLSPMAVGSVATLFQTTGIQQPAQNHP